MHTLYFYHKHSKVVYYLFKILPRYDMLVSGVTLTTSGRVDDQRCQAYVSKLVVYPSPVDHCTKFLMRYTKGNTKCYDMNYAYHTKYETMVRSAGIVSACG